MRSSGDAAPRNTSACETHHPLLSSCSARLRFWEEPGELLVTTNVVGRELTRDLIGLGRRFGVAELIGADVAEPRPQFEQLLGRRVAADALELAAIRADQVLPVLA